MIVPSYTLTQAVAYIQSKYTEFSQLGRKLWLAQMKAAATARVLRDAGKDDTEAVRVIKELGETRLEWADTMSKLQPLAERAGLGAVPLMVVFAVSGIALAGAMYAIFRRRTAAERALDLVHDGLTPAEQSTVRAIMREQGGDAGLFGGLADAAMWIAVAAAAAFVLPGIVKR